MTVKELIERLQEYSPDQEVVINVWDDLVPIVGLGDDFDFPVCLDADLDSMEKAIISAYRLIESGIVDHVKNAQRRLNDARREVIAFANAPQWEKTAKDRVLVAERELEEAVRHSERTKKRIENR